MKKIILYSLLVMLIACGILNNIAYGIEGGPERFNRLLGENWYGLYMQNAKIGYVKISLEKTNSPVTGWRMENQMEMKAVAAGIEMSISIKDLRYYDSPSGEQVASEYLMTGPTGEVKVTGKISGDEYHISTSIGGQQKEKTFARPIDCLDSLLCMELKIISEKAAVGDSLGYTYFEPTPPLTGPIHNTATIADIENHILNGVSTKVFSVRGFIRELNTNMNSKLDQSGTLLEGDLGGGLLIKLESEQLAKQLDKNFDILEDNIIRTTMKIDDPRPLKHLELTISGMVSRDLLETPRQKFVSADSDKIKLSIKRQNIPIQTLSIPIRIDTLVGSLRAEPYIQSDDPEIINLAKTIIGNETDAWKAAKKINDWVYVNIEKEFTAALSNALETLHSRKGDCGEHTALAVALMRAAGIPANPIFGLVYWPPGGGFGYHAWVEVYVGEWIQMDPSWGEELVNPSHIAMARGDLISQSSMFIRTLGNLKIDIDKLE